VWARFGFAPRFADGPVVVWCASVGEVNTAARLIRGLLAEAKRPVVVAAYTPAGLAHARDLFGTTAGVTLAPLDSLPCAALWLRRVQPSAVVLFETELWPAFVLTARRFGVKIALVNGRLSDRNFPRYRRLRYFLLPIVRRIDLLLVQSGEFAKRFGALGADQARTHAVGSLKFDVEPPREPDAAVQSFYRAFVGPRRVIVAGSTHSSEEQLLAEAVRQLRDEFPDLALIVAPRHLKRASDAAVEITATGLRLLRRSSLDVARVARADVLLLDVMGELTWAYGLATLAFVGGSFTFHGGHNVLEPSRSGVPVIVGPRTPNFRVEVETLHRAGALTVAASGPELAATLAALLRDDDRRRRMIEAAKQAAAAHQGATERTLARLRSWWS
jgi:3-deoxy-D-manno-octulosonic-acid transferase